MPTDKQRIASRRNGAKSRGPVTEAGRQRSAGNAAKHHITSQALLIPGESAAELDAHFAAYVDRFQPADAVELDLVRNLAFVAWRQGRLWRREADLITAAAQRARQHGEFAADHAAASDGWRSLACQPAMALLQREEAALRRAFDRALRTLRELQERRPEPLPPGPDAKLQNEPEEPQTVIENNVVQPPQRVSENGNGFVLSPEPAAAAGPVPRPQSVHRLAAAKYHCPQC